MLLCNSKKAPSGAFLLTKYEMILVNDPYNLVPELFESFPEFSKSLESDVDVLPAVCRESFQLSKKLTNE